MKAVRAIKGWVIPELVKIVNETKAMGGASGLELRRQLENSAEPEAKCWEGTTNEDGQRTVFQSHKQIDKVAF